MKPGKMVVVLKNHLFSICVILIKKQAQTSVNEEQE
jgi:hypothetical protein